MDLVYGGSTGYFAVDVESSMEDINEKIRQSLGRG